MTTASAVFPVDGSILDPLTQKSLGAGCDTLAQSALKDQDDRSIRWVNIFGHIHIP
jgi:hypothetical protein